jgi:biopolymer transport protein ExbD
MTDADKADALTLSVMRDGQMFLGNERVTGDALTQRVRDTWPVGPTKLFTSVLMRGPDTELW